MDFMLLTQNSTPIFKYIVKLLGLIMNGIFEFLNLIGIPNIGLSIILFTIVIYLLLMPLTIKQQKFSKLQVRMNPEIQAIQAKYKGKQDQASTACPEPGDKGGLCQIRRVPREAASSC